ncbi:integration host factor subunit beta [Francisellaceae bacterium]|nr:integration host factor subunit beta [Francisellaceae bacterium]
MHAKKINKSEIIETLAYKFQIEKSESKNAVDCIIQKMISSLSRGKRIEVRGFGAFTVRTLKPKKSRNPKTGEALDLGEKYQVHFKPGEPLRKRINQFTAKNNH